MENYRLAMTFPIRTTRRRLVVDEDPLEDPSALERAWAPVSAEDSR